MAAGTNEGEVSGHDDCRTLGDSRHGGLEKALEDAQGLAGSDDERSIAPIEGGSIGERESAIKQQVADTELSKEIDAIFSKVQITSGPIPDADALAAYPVSIQERIIDWQERQIKAMFDDESKRQDRIVDAEISQGARNQWLSFVVNFVIVVGALVAFVLTGNPNVFWSYTILGASVIGNVVVHINDHGKRLRSDERIDLEDAE